MKTRCSLSELFNSLSVPSDYVHAKLQSVEIDECLEFQIYEVESRLREREEREGKVFQSWSKLHPQAFQTPYSELIELVKRLNPPELKKTWVDLGAGYGRLGFVVEAFAPLSAHIGYENAPERVLETKRVYSLWNLKRCEIIQQDLMKTDFQPISADFYFIYDYGDAPSIRKTIEDLRQIASERPIQIIARGLGIQNEIDRNAPWLCVIPPIRLPHSSIYRTDAVSGTPIYIENT